VVVANRKEFPDLKETMRWAIFLRIVILSGILIPGMTILHGPESHFLSLRLSFFYGVTIFYSLLEYLYARKESSVIFQIYSHLFFDLVIVSSIVDATGSVGSPFTFLYILLILEAGMLLRRSGAVMWATISSLVYLLLGILRFWGEGPLFSDFERDGSLITGGSGHPILDVFFPLSLFYLVALIIGFIDSRLSRAGDKVHNLSRELKRLSMETADIFFHIPSGVLTCDLAKRLIFVNPAGLKLLDLERKDSVGHPIERVFSVRHKALDKLIDQTFQENLPVNRAEVVLQGEDGKKKVDLGVSTSLLKDVNGTILGVTAIFQDISHLKELDAVSKRNLKFKTLTELSASMAHEIKNPLATINSSLEMLDRSSLTDEGKNLLDMIKAESVRLSQLLEDYLRFARIKVREWKKIDLLELVEEVKVLLMVRQDISSRISIDFDGFDGSGKDFIWGDPELVKQIFLNLFINSAEAIIGHGSIHVRFEGCEGVNEIDRAERANFQRIFVEDDGPGFSIEGASKAFNPFFTTKSEGSGLGLVIVQKIVDAHHGKIVLHNKKDEGACFILSLPITNPAQMDDRKNVRLVEQES
jgi:two-component system sensor histidine kinase PilS (NtrC family)